MPWPSSSRADSDSEERMRSAPKPSTNQRAPTTLRLQSEADQPSASLQAPVKPRGSAPSPGTSAKAGESGAMPESTTPTTTPAPPRRRGLSAAPRTAAIDVRPASGRTVSASTVAMPGWSARALDLHGAQLGGEAVERGGPPVDGLTGADGREHRVLAGEQVVGVRAAGRGAGAREGDEGEGAGRRAGGGGVVSRGGRSGGDRERERDEAASEDPSWLSVPACRVLPSSRSRCPDDDVPTSSSTPAAGPRRGVSGSDYVFAQPDGGRSPGPPILCPRP